MDHLIPAAIADQGFDLTALVPGDALGGLAAYSAEDAARIARVRQELLAAFPDWPRDASLLVIGTFTPTGGEPQAFRVFFEAEIEIEMELNPPVVIDATSTNPSFTVRIDPALMFRNSNGTVRNLAVLDFDATGQVPEFEVEIENGITEVEFDD